MLFRKDMECEVKIDNLGKYTAKGKVSFLNVFRFTLPHAE